MLVPTRLVGVDGGGDTTSSTVVAPRGDPNRGFTGMPAIMGLTAAGLEKALNGSVPLPTKDEGDVKPVTENPVEPNGDADGSVSGPGVVELEDAPPNPHDVVDPKEKVGALVPCPKVRLVVEPDPKGAAAGAGGLAVVLVGVLPNDDSKGTVDVVLGPGITPKPKGDLFSDKDEDANPEAGREEDDGEAAVVLESDCSISSGLLGRG
jgi:hypothetical protein